MALMNRNKLATQLFKFAHRQILPASMKGLSVERIQKRRVGDLYVPPFIKVKLFSISAV